ncbi:MAG: ROK family protein [Firmicutes bacterium]|jgi:glucokinase|nr:ROK family protein [Bacillota bacterium]
MRQEPALLVIDIGGTNTICETYDLGGRELTSETDSTARVFSQEVEGFVHHVKGIIQSHMVRYPHTIIASIVVGVPGIVSTDGSKVISCPNLQILDGVSLGEELYAATGVCTHVYKDSELAAIAEQQMGAARGFTSAACVVIGTGIGCGLVLNDRIWRGEHSLAGELGHTTIIPHGRICTCGRRGCLEMYCSGKAFGRQAIELGIVAIDQQRKDDPNLARLVFDAAKRGDSAAVEVITNGFTLLGIALANLVNVLNPGIIVLGGGVMSGGSVFWPVIEESYRESVRSSAVSVPAIVESQLQAKPVTKGAWVEAKRIVGGC